MNTNQSLVLGFPEYADEAKRLAHKLGIRCEIIELHRFPDGESLVRLPPQLPAHVIVMRSLDRPNDKLVELMLTAETARQLGATRLTLVAPYLCYMRQDIANRPGEAVSQRIVGGLLARLFDDLITVDPHLHRVHDLYEAAPVACAVTLHASEIMGDYLCGHVTDPILLGPDGESVQWVSAMAKRCNFAFYVAEKQRFGDRDVRIALPPADYRNREVVLVDDVASTGQTLINIAVQVKEAGAAKVHAMVTHALFAEDAFDQLKQCGIDRIWSTDSIPHASNAIQLDELLANSVEGLPKTT